MTLFAPSPMRARHFETGKWHTLIFARDDYNYWATDSAPWNWYLDNDAEEGGAIDLANFDAFEAVTH
jgi:hypothetical protein